MKNIFVLIMIIVFNSSIAFAQKETVTEDNSNHQSKSINPNSPQATNDKIEFKNSSGAPIITITDEGARNGGSITLPPLSSSTLLNPLNKLYNQDGTLKFNGSVIGSNGGADSINQLADAKYDGSSLFLGVGAGMNDDGSFNRNVGVGASALHSNTIGTYNTAIGYEALLSNTTGLSNSAIGRRALFFNTGSYNSAIGVQALYSNSTGSSNSAIGVNALYSNTIGSGNTAIGTSALYGNLSGDNNIAIGKAALYYNQTGSFNKAIGHNALNNNQTGSSNTAIGDNALYYNTIGNSNVSVGDYANFRNEQGSKNTIIGHEAGRHIISHSKSGNVFIGYKAGFWELGNNKLYIQNDSSTSPLIWGDFTDGSEKVRINGDFETTSNLVAMGNNALASGSGSFAFGSSAESTGGSSFAVGNNAKATNNSAHAYGSNAEANGTYSTAIGFNVEADGNFSRVIGSYARVNALGSMFLADYSSATVHTTTIDNIFNARFANGYKLFTSSDLSSGAQMLAGANSWSVISDSTKKENFKSVNGEEILNKISEFNLRTWNYKGQDPSKFRHYGPMAQEFYNAFGNDGIGTIGNDTTIASADFDGINLVAIQALEQRTSEQKSLIHELKDEIKELKIKNSQLARVNDELRNSYVEMNRKIRNSSNIEERLTELEILIRNQNKLNSSVTVNK